MLYFSSSQQGQRGAFSIMAAGTLLMSLIFLVLTLDSGRLYMEQRRLQKIADTAAIESISRVENGNCSTSGGDAQKFAEDNAKRSNFVIDQGVNPKASCVDLTIEDGLTVATINKEKGHAVQVDIFKTVPASLIVKAQGIFSNIPTTVTLSAQAIASRGQQPTAIFTVGSELLRLENDKLVGQLLKTVGLDPKRLTLLNKNGLANAHITPSGLLKALGVEVGIDQLNVIGPEGLVNLVNTQVHALGIQRLLNVSAELAGVSNVLAAELNLIGQKILSEPLLKDININLLGLSESAGQPRIPGLITLDSHSLEPVSSTLDATINLGEIVSTAVLIGLQGTGRGIVIPHLKALGQTVELGIVEPPSIGIGPVGTTAYNAQIRLYIGVDTDNLLGGLLKLLSTRINLPIWIDLISGHGTLDKISCDTENPTADISVESTVLNVCIGKLPEELKWSGSASCESKLQEDELIKLLGIPVLSGMSHIPAVTQEFLSKDYKILRDIKVDETRSSPVIQLPLGNTAESIVKGLLELLNGLFRSPKMPSNFISKLNHDSTETEQNKLIEKTAKEYLKASAGNNGKYDVNKTINLLIRGSAERTEDGEQVIPPLMQDWAIDNIIPTTHEIDINLGLGLGLGVKLELALRPVSEWDNGTFESAFKAYSDPNSLLATLGISTLGNGYKICGGLLDNRNSCLEHNLIKFLKSKPGGLNFNQTNDEDVISDDNFKCKGLLCILLKPVIALLKPILNGVGLLVSGVLTDILGLEIGRTDVTVHSISCGAPRLVK